MKGKGWFSTTVILLLFLALSPAVAWGANPPDIDSKIKDEQGRLEAIEKQISFHQKQIQQARRKEQGLLDDLSRIDQSVTLLKQKVALLDLQREKAELFAQVMADAGAVPRGLSESDLRALLS